MFDQEKMFSDQERERLGELERNISAAQEAKTSYLREIFRKKGLIAPTLGELSSDKGPFIEEEWPRGKWRGCYRGASVRKKISPDLGSNSGFSIVLVTAYLCREVYSPREDSDSCGWVKGDPLAREYNDIGFLSGSAGIRYYCQICGKLIGEKISVVS